YVTEILKKSVADVDHRGRQALGGEVSADLQSTRRTKKARLSFFSMGPTFSLPQHSESQCRITESAGDVYIIAELGSRPGDHTVRRVSEEGYRNHPTRRGTH